MRNGVYTDKSGRRVQVMRTSGGGHLLRYADGTTTVIGGSR